MAKQRQISDKFWSDTYVAEELTDPEEKLLFIYLLTNQLIDITGIYEISIRQINFDTGIKSDRIKEIIQKLSGAGKVFYESGHVIMANYHKYASYNVDGVRNYVIRHTQALPKPLREKHESIIESIVSLAKVSDENLKPQGKGKATPTQAQGKGSKNEENPENPTPTQGLSKGKERAGQGQPYSYTSIHTSNDTYTSIPSPPSPPKGRPALDPQVWIKDPVTGETVRNPALEGRKEGKENNQASGKGRKEGKEEEEIVDWGAIKIKGSDVDKLYDEFGKDVTWDAIDKASEWAEAKGIKVNKDPYKFVRGFAIKEASNG